MIALAFVAAPIVAFIVARRSYWRRRMRSIKWEIVLYPQRIVRSRSAPPLIKDVP